MESAGKQGVSLIGIIFGKFFPPHEGHLAVVNHALSMCKKLYIIVCANSGSTPSGQQRAYWLQHLVPNAEVLLTDDLCDWHFGSPCVDACTDVWSKKFFALVPESVDLVFTSEEYGDAFASAIGASHISVDKSRHVYPVSASQVRSDLSNNWTFIPRVVRAGLYRKVVILGSESSGTTTLAQDLAVRLDAPWVAEIGRTISWELAIRAGGIKNAEWNEGVFWRVLREQARAEVDAVHAHCDKPPGDLGPWLVCDTDAVATVVWWERYLKTPSIGASNFAAPYLGDMYVVTDPGDVEFNQDGLRDGEHLRYEMHNSFIETARKTNQLVIVVTGTPEERVKQVLTELENFEDQIPRFTR